VPHREIDLGSLGAARLEIGSGEMRDGFVHRKIVPFAIVVQPTRGHYVVSGTEGSARVGSGEVALVAAHIPVAFSHHADRGSAMAARWLHIQATLDGALDPCALKRTPCSIAGEPARRIGALLDELHGISGDGAAERFAQLGLSCRILALALAAAPDHPRARELAAATARLAPIMRWIEAHLHRPLDIHALARAAGLSRSRLHALFQQRLGRSPMAQVKELRLQAAARRLLISADRVGEVAEATGFANAFHFSREFARRYGMPPREYRDAQRRWTSNE
jgi:AraC-like DNA-binding protein